MNSLAEMIAEVCSQHAPRVCLIHEGNRITYGQFHRYVDSLAAGLQNLGVRKGDRVALMLPNCPEFPISYFACQKIGAVAVTLSVLATPYELGHLLTDSGSRILITQEQTAPRFREIADELAVPPTLLTTRGLHEPSPFRELVGDYHAKPAPVAIGEEDGAVMIYTSGLTGRPLGAVLTHGNLLGQSLLLKIVFGGTAEDRSLAVIPFFHAFGAATNMLAALRVGGSICLMERFTLEGIFNTIQNERVTYVCAVPRLFIGMVFQQGAERYDLGSLRFCVTGGAAMPVEFFAEFHRRFGAVLMEGYGLTEAGPVCSVNPLFGVQKPGSIGPPIPGVELAILDEGGTPLPIGREGELVVRGGNVMRGYHNNDEATREVLRGGWLHTGDLARMDEDGYFFITGRKKRMIITSGFNVYPKEVEDVLRMHPAVKEARVEGKEDLLRGEIVRALIVRDPAHEADERQIMRHCRRYLSSYKVPREVAFVEKL